MICKFRSLSLALLLVALLSARSEAGVFGAPYTYGTDAQTGVTSFGRIYTHAYDINGDGPVTVNGVLFTASGATGPNYSLTGAAQTFDGDVTNVAPQAGLMLDDFIFTSDGSGNANLTLTGLTPGTTYTTMFLGQGFGVPTGRFFTVTASDTNTATTADQNGFGSANGWAMTYTFVAPGGGQISYAFDAASNGDSFHHYAFANYTTPVPEPASLVLLASGALVGLAVALRRRRK